MSKKPNGHFTMEPEEYSSSEFVFTALSILESQGYGGFFELMSLIKDPVLIIQIIRLFYGTSIKVPLLKDFAKCLQASTYIYCDMHKHVNAISPAKPKDIRNFLKIDKQEEEELLEIYKNWVIYMNKQGRDVRDYLHINRSSTKKQINRYITEEKKNKGKK